MSSLNDPSESAFDAEPTICIRDEQVAFDIAFLDKVLEQNANHVDALRQQVELLASCGDYSRALELDLRLVELRPSDRVAYYNLACSLSMLGRIEAAIDALEQSILLGYDDMPHLEIDADLDPLRCVSKFWDMLDKYGLC